MIHRTRALSQIQHGGKRAGDIVLGPSDGIGEGAALGEIGSNGAGERAARSVGVGVVDALSGEPHSFAIGNQKIVGVMDAVTALEQHGAMTVPADLLRRGDHIVLAFDGQAGENLSFRDVRRDKRCQRQQFAGQRLHGVRLHAFGVERIGFIQLWSQQS